MMREMWHDNKLSMILLFSGLVFIGAWIFTRQTFLIAVGLILMVGTAIFLNYLQAMRDIKRMRRIAMETMEFQGKRIEVTKDGYLIHPDDWSRELAECLAKSEGLELTNDHWWFIDYIRNYYLENGILPMIRYLIANAEKNIAIEYDRTRYMYELFPAGPKLICKLAGVPKPVG